MLAPLPAGVPPSARENADRLLLERLRLMVVVVLAAMPFYALADFYFRPATFGLLQLEKVVLCSICLLIWWATRQDELRPHARLIGIMLVATLATTSAASSNLTDQYTSHAFLTVMIMLFAGTLAPWGAVTQVIAVLIMAASVLWNVYDVVGSFDVLLSYPAFAVGITWVASVCMAWLLDENQRALVLENFERERAEMAMREEAATSTALAHVAEQLIAVINTPELLERLSQLTVQTVGCDWSWTVLRKQTEDVFTIAAHAGFDPEQSAALDLLTILPDALAPLLARLEREGVVGTNPGDGFPIPGAPLAERFSVTTWMHVGLWRGAQLIGYHAAGYERPGVIVSSQQQRLLRGITHLASMALETARLVEELNRANRFKSDFVANISHELRTPVNVIMGYNELLLDGAFGPLTPEQAGTLRHTDQQARELLDMINVTLDLSRIEAASGSVLACDICVAELFAELARETSALPSRPPQLHWVWNAAPQLPPIRTDPVKLRMVLKNLVQNAMKFTPHGTVSVEASTTGDGVEFRIADTGIGIHPEAQVHIFEPFFQVNADRSQPRGGAGLGLYIVGRLLEMLGGRISLESAVGRGSIFRVWLPLRIEPAATGQSALR